MYWRVSWTTFGTASGESTIKSYQSDTMYACSIEMRGDIVILDVSPHQSYPMPLDVSCYLQKGKLWLIVVVYAFSRIETCMQANIFWFTVTNGKQDSRAILE